MTALARAWGRACAVLALTATIAGADSTATSPAARTRIGGQFYGDYLYTLSGAVQDSSAFQIRRVYLIADHDLAERIASRVTIEAENGTLAANGRLTPFLKMAYLEFKQVWPGASLFAGLAPTPLWGTTEEVWGYRSVEKTPLDLRGFGSASDLGVALRGRLQPVLHNPMSHQRTGSLEYHLMFANGSTQKPESDRSKKAYASITLRNGPFVLEPHFDYEGAPRGEDRKTLKLLLGWQRERWAVGGEIWGRLEYPRPAGQSVFARTLIGERFAVFGRYDRFDPHAASSAAPSIFSHNVFVGLDWMPIPDVHLIPNLALEAFTNEVGSGPGRESDVVARITLSYQYRER